MPDIHKIGELAEVKNRYPHKQNFTCTKCKSQFGLNVGDSRSDYYKVTSRTVTEGDQREQWQATRLYIEFLCPLCGNQMEDIAPVGWTHAFAKGLDAPTVARRSWEANNGRWQGDDESPSFPYDR